MHVCGAVLRISSLENLARGRVLCLLIVGCVHACRVSSSSVTDHANRPFLDARTCVFESARVCQLPNVA